jgi:hypothetical protein
MKIFISYDSKDDNKMRTVCRILQKANKEFLPLIVIERKAPNTTSAEKVIEGIEEATHIVPIITRISKTNQWVNQEIGYALASGKAVFPIVESQIIKSLKGFITDEDSLDFKFNGNKQNPKVENISYRKACHELAAYLNDTIPDIFTSEIIPVKVNAGEDYITTVTFKGKITNGFFDNQIIHQESNFRGWQWDQNTLKFSNRYHIDKTPGELSGNFNRTWQYKNSTNGLLKGKYKIIVYLFSHRRPGRKGRIPLAKNEHEFEIL